MYKKQVSTRAHIARYKGTFGWSVPHCALAELSLQLDAGGRSIDWPAFQAWAKALRWGKRCNCIPRHEGDVVVSEENLQERLAEAFETVAWLAETRRAREAAA